MHVAPLLVLVLAGSLLETALSLWLSRRQISHVSTHRDTVPADFTGSVSLDEHRRAAAYTVARERLAVAQSVWEWATGAAWLLFGFDLLYGAIARASDPSLLRSTVFVLAYGGIAALLSLPFSLYRTFGIEQRFGFNRTRPALFLADRLKGVALALLLGVPLLYAGFWLMRTAAGLWWLYGWAGLVALMLAAPSLYVRLIAPRFNRFTPLPDGALKQAIETLMADCGFHASALFTMDASRRSAHGNAFFIGFGRSKRIVLFDTLVAQSPLPEIRAIIAHELGHFRHRHVLFGMARSAVMLFCMLAAFGWLSRQGWLLPGFGLRQHDDALSLIACLLCWSLAGPLAALFGNWISRRHEFEADAFARRNTGTEPMVSALVRLSRDNASTLTPDPLYALYHYSHPPVPVRIDRLRGLESHAV